MSTIEDFENAPIGATATHNDGGRAMKTRDAGRSWVTPGGSHLDDKEMAYWGYTLDPLPPLPPFPPFPHTTAREALDLAWELAHPLKEGQGIPTGTRYVSRSGGGDLATFTAGMGWTPTPSNVKNVRTLDPLPEPEPEWRDAPAVVALVRGRVGGRQVFARENEAGTQWVRDTKVYRWDELIDVVPLYPKENS